MRLPLAVFTTGSPVPSAQRARGDFYRMITEATGPDFPGGFHNVCCQSALSYQDPRSYSGIIVTGSAARLNDQEDWMLRTEDALRVAHHAEVPILGICFGHQLLGEALGGKVAPNPNGREIGTVALSHCEEDSLLDGLTADPTIVMTHLDSVVELPQNTKIVRKTALDPHAALRFSETTWGVQFHPEMDAEIVGYYLEERRSDIEAEGIDVTRILRERKKSSYGRQLMQRFAQVCLSRSG